MPFDDVCRIPRAYARAPRLGGRGISQPLPAAWGGTHCRPPSSENLLHKTPPQNNDLETHPYDFAEILHAAPEFR